MPQADAASFLPLKPAWFHILLTVAEAPSHGYAIRQAVEARTNGALRLWPATLYGSIGAMEDAGLLERWTGAPQPDDDVERRFYRVTALGRRMLRAETERLESLARLGRAAMRRKRTS